MVLPVSSSTTNQWPQNHIDEKQFMASTDRDMETPSQEVQLQNQNQINQNLKCPRCDSSNTKFCYYNNYSLSQPRHFCKACKRYWTRGGTLRNVPVGGGCRKNKKIKKQPSLSTSIDGPNFSSTSTSNPNVLQPQISISSTSNPINPFLYGVPANPSELNLPYPSFNSRVSEFHLDQPHMNALGLGFSSNGFYPNKENHDEDIVVTSNPLLSSYAMFGSSSASTSPNMASFLASSLHIGETYGELKEVKMEGGPNRLDWNVNFQNQIEQSDPSLYWNATNVGPWLDPSNGSSLPSLI